MAAFFKKDGVDGRLVSLERFFDTFGKTIIEEYKIKMELDLATAIEPYRKADIYKSEGSTSSSNEEREFFLILQMSLFLIQDVV